MRSNLLIFTCFFAFCSAVENVSAQDKSGRTNNGLQVLYDFSSPSGSLVKDRSGVGQPVDLIIANPGSVRRNKGSLEVRGSTLIESKAPPAKIIAAVRRSGEISIEAWVRPAGTKQDGPARIVSFSKSTSERNFTLGQEGAKFDARFRSTKTSMNGMPSLGSPNKSLTTQLTHVVYTRDRKGRARIYVNGRQTAERSIAGDTSNWNGSFRLALANELTKDRPWLGTFYLVAIYGRAILPSEVEQDFQAGPKWNSEASSLELARRSFETEIAPLMARHCLECHDSASKKGGLDLSRKELALAGGESGRVIVPGKADQSLLWKYVQSNEMPADRPPLKANEKEQLRKWIDAGAAWTLKAIDPAVYAHDTNSGQTWVQRLTVSEYIETVRSAVGVDIAKEAREVLPPDLRADGFSNTAYNLNVDLKHIEAYARLAAIIVERMDVIAFARNYSRSQRLTDPNMRPLISKMGQWILRGPLEEQELDTYRGISTTVASTGGDFKEAVSFILEAMLQSPRFIYRIENQRGDGTAWPANEFELASRLSYIIWGGPPDKELMKAAETGSLDRVGVLRQAERMLQDPRAIQRSVQFATEWLNLDRLSNMQPNRKRYPNWNPQLAADMREETLEFFKEVVWNQKRPLSGLLNAQVTFVTPRLAKHYGFKEIKETNNSAAARYDLTSEPGRGGLLSQGSILTVGGDEASMVSRGLFVLHDLLRGVVKDPPPCVDTTPVPTKSGLTQRGIAAARIANKNCGGCHAKFEPLAFGLEKFDGLGTFHDRDHHGNKLRDDGEILFPGAAKPLQYKSSAELMNILASSERVRQTITWKLTQFALGRPLGAADAPILEKIHQDSQQNGGTYASLITAIVQSDLVQKTRTELGE